MPSDLASLIAPIGCGSGLMCGFTQGALTTDDTDQVIGRAFWESVDRGTTSPLVCLIRVLRVISGCSCSGACFAVDRGDRRCGHVERARSTFPWRARSSIPTRHGGLGSAAGRRRFRPSPWTRPDPRTAPIRDAGLAALAWPGTVCKLLADRDHAGVLVELPDRVALANARVTARSLTRPLPQGC